MLTFFLWLIAGCFFVLLGIYAILSKKDMPFRFWANAKPFPVNHVKAYNRAVGKLWCVYGIVFILLGAPLIKGQNTPYILFSILGLMAETIIAMAVYTTVIETKYRKK